MTCSKVQSLITPFINNKLSLKELEAFVNHISSCSVCREELEVYYALLTAMKQLDEDKNLSSDFGIELDQKLERARERIFHEKFTYYRKKIILFFTMIVLAFIISIGYAGKSSQESAVKESNFRLRNVFRTQESVELEAMIQEYQKQQEALPDSTKVSKTP